MNSGRVARVDPTGSAGDLELWELHEELLREVSGAVQGAALNVICDAQQ